VYNFHDQVEIGQVGIGAGEGGGVKLSLLSRYRNHHSGSLEAVMPKYSSSIESLEILKGYSRMTYSFIIVTDTSPGRRSLSLTVSWILNCNS